MWVSFLLFIAAVPLLGEAQINKPKNEAKNRKKIRKNEAIPSCDTDSTSFTNERSPLLMDLPKSAKLFGQPGTRHRSPLHWSSLIFFLKIIGLSIFSDPRVGVRVSNLGSLPSHLLFSHQEAFPAHNLDTSGTHVELVAGIQPAEVEEI